MTQNNLKLMYANFDQEFNPDLLLMDGEGVYTPERYPYPEEMYKIIGACMEVHTVLGMGFLERVYHEALCHELTLRGIPFESDKVLKIYYKETELKKTYTADIIAYGHIMVELKALNGPLDPHHSQVINYLSATRHELGLLVNFGMPSLKYKRFIVSRNNRYINNKKPLTE